KELLRRRGLAFNPDAHRRFVDRLITTFTPAYFKRVASFGLGDELPVFDVGMMRSGTTLAGQILASHPRVHGAGELLDIERLANDLPRRLGSAEAYPECLGRLGGGASRVVDKLPANFLHLGLIATLFPKARVVHCRRDPVDT